MHRALQPVEQLSLNMRRGYRAYRGYVGLLGVISRGFRSVKDLRVYRACRGYIGVM